MEPKHSRIGIASFVVSLIVLFLLVIDVAVAGVLHSRYPDGPYPGQAVVGVVIIALILADLVAAGLGIAALFERDRKKVFGVLGLVFTALTAFGGMGLILIGLIARFALHQR